MNFMLCTTKLIKISIKTIAGPSFFCIDDKQLTESEACQIAIATASLSIGYGGLAMSYYIIIRRFCSVKKYIMKKMKNAVLYFIEKNCTIAIFYVILHDLYIMW